MPVNPSAVALWLYFSAVGYICNQSMGAAIALVTVMTLSAAISLYEHIQEFS